MDQRDFELIIRQGKRPLWRIVLSGVFFTLMFYVIFDDWVLVSNNPSGESLRHVAKSLYHIALMFTLGVYNAMETDILIDVDKDLLITRYRVGPITVDRKSPVPELEYVAVFCEEEHDYQVNLWYKGNRHFKMYKFPNREDAFLFADKVANKLNLDILDSSVRGEKKWIERRVADA